MKPAVAVFLLVLAIGGAPSPAHAQQIGIAPHASTLGIGVDVALAVHPRLNVRAGGNFFPFDLDLEASDIDFTIDLPSPQFTALLDLFVVSGLRLSGGFVLSTPDIEATGDFTAPIEVGGTVYTPTEVGNLTGAIVNNDVSPYLGIGWGNVAKSKIGFFLDVGVAFQGAPQVTLTADGTASGLATFQQDLDQEIADIESDIDVFKYYPVVAIGVSIGL